MKSVVLVPVESEDDPVCNTSVIRWHVLHGWCYKVWECDWHSGRPIAVFYITLMCGDGGFVHFDALVEDCPAFVIRRAIRAGLALAARELPVVFAHIPKRKERLIRYLLHIGFVHIVEGDFHSHGEDFALLKFLNR